MSREEASYMPNVRVAEELMRKENAWRWLRYHEKQLRNHQRVSALIAAHHRQEIASLERYLGIVEHKGDAA